MKTPLKVAGLIVSSLVLASCASTGDFAARSEPTRAGPPDPIITDEAYVSAVERAALRRGVMVQWVNVPTKRIARE